MEARLSLGVWPDDGIVTAGVTTNLDTVVAIEIGGLVADGTGGGGMAVVAGAGGGGGCGAGGCTCEA